MWKLLLDPVFQGVAFVVALLALAFAVWDLYDDARSPAAVAPFTRRKPSQARETPRTRAEAVEPSVETWLDGQGTTHGRVRRGPARGRRLEELTREECEAQAGYCRDNDPASALTVERYIRERFGAQRRYDAGSAEAGGMSRPQAYAELGLREGASEAAIHAAYRKLIKTHHPDHGGSHAKAARINQAKTLLEG